MWRKTGKHRKSKFLIELKQNLTKIYGFGAKIDSRKDKNRKFVGKTKKMKQKEGKRKSAEKLLPKNTENPPKLVKFSVFYRKIRQIPRIFGKFPGFPPQTEWKFVNFLHFFVFFRSIFSPNHGKTDVFPLFC